MANIGFHHVRIPWSGDTSFFSAVGSFAQNTGKVSSHSCKNSLLSQPHVDFYIKINSS